jgi:gluconokinase
MTAVYVIMGVSGCGKTTVGRALAAELGCPFYDGDDFHPPENVARMAQGIPLNDADRAPWLARLAALIRGRMEREETAVLACSALKRPYREQLRVNEQVQFVYLHGAFALIRQRMQQRGAHYMPAALLHSQFAALEPPGPQEALIVDAALPVDAIVAAIRRAHHAGTTP